MDSINNNEIDPIKLYPPGAQKLYDHIISCNSLYFCYCTTISIVIFERPTNKIKSIISPSTNFFLRTVALNKGAKQDLAAFFDLEIIIYNLMTEKPRLCLPISNVSYLEFNTADKLLAVTDKGDLAYFDLATAKDFKNAIKMIKTDNRVVMAQWYPFTTSDIAYITNKNEVYYQSILTPNQISPIHLEIEISKDKSFQITEMAWYDADDNYKYLIIGTNTSYIVLVDLNDRNPMIISTFDHYGNGIKKLLWLTYEPGSFISMTKNCGRISIWNVSKASYNHIVKLTDFAIKSSIKYDNETIMFSTSKGEVVLFNMKLNKKMFYIDSGHCESIFDIKFNPLSYGIFATCSHDGSIKIWNMMDNSLQLTLYLDLNPNSLERSKEERVNVICIKWSPRESDLIASGDSKSCVKLWNINKEKQVASLRFDTKSNKDPKIFGLDWGKDDLVICGCQMSIYISQYSNGKFSTIKIIPVEQSIFHIKINPHEEKEIGVACKDGIIRAYNISDEKNAPVKTYIGHKYKVFGLCYSTSVRVMASSSDDFKIGIWDLNKEEKNNNNFLLGHTDNVRSLIWLEKHSNVIISGSCDSTIRFWNVKQMVCIAMINEHLSDVYGLDICPDHPFLIISASRDNTIRFWNYSQHPLAVLTDFSSGDSIKAKDISLNSESSSGNSNTPVALAEKISNFYYYEDGIKLFWQMAAQIISPPSTSSNTSHTTSWQSTTSGLLNEYLEYNNTTKTIENSYFNNSKINYSKRKEDIIKEMRDRCAKSGQWKQYCEFCIRINDWEGAIMSAPHVSIDYWKHLTNKYADYCVDNNFNRDTRLSSILLSDNVDLMLKELFERGDYEEAKLIWITRNKKRQVKEFKEEDANGQNQIEIQSEIQEELSDLLKDSKWKNDYLCPMIALLAEKKLIEGKPFHASYHYLSINDICSAIKVLVQSNQLEIAYLLMRLFNCFLYEEDIICGICNKKKDNISINDLTTLIIQSNHLTTKVMLHQIIESKSSSSSTLPQGISIKITEEVKNSNDNLLHAVISTNINDITKICINKSNELLLLISSQETSILKEFKDMIKVYQSLKGIEIDITNPLSYKLKIRLMLCASTMEIINNNMKGASCLITQYIKLLSIPQESKYEHDHNDYASLKFTYDYLKGHSNINDNAYWLSPESKAFIDNVLSQRQGMLQAFSGDYYKSLQTSLAESIDEDAKMYLCKGSKYHKFYYIKREEFPKNFNSIDVSSFSNIINKHNGIKLANGNIASMSEYLELKKYSCH